MKLFHGTLKGRLYLGFVLHTFLAIVCDSLTELLKSLTKRSKQCVKAFFVLCVKNSLTLVEHLHSHVTYLFLQELVLLIILTLLLQSQFFSMATH